MTLTEVQDTSPEFAAGPFGPGLLVVYRSPATGLFPPTGEMIEWASHMLAYHGPTAAGPLIDLAPARRRKCPATGVPFLTARLGRAPLVLERTRRGTIRVRVGYRRYAPDQETP